jgi:hypothetical protein
MERLHPSPLDLDSAGMLVANFLQSWRQAGWALTPPPQSPSPAYDLKNPNPPSPEDGLRLPAPIHDGPSLPPPGEHSAAVRVEGASSGTGLATEPDPGAGCRPGDLGHANEQPPGLQDAGSRCVTGQSRSRLRLGGFALIALVQRLASVARDLLPDRNPDRRCRWLLRSGRFQRPVVARPQRDYVPGRTAFPARAPPGRQAQQSPARRTALSPAGGLCLWRGTRQRLARPRCGSPTRRAIGLHPISTNRQRLRGRAALPPTPVEFSPARLRRSVERQNLLGAAPTRTRAGLIEQSLLCRGLRFRALSRPQIHIDRRPDSVQNSEAADWLLAGFDPGASSRLPRLG